MKQSLGQEGVWQTASCEDHARNGKLRNMKNPKRTGQPTVPKKGSQQKGRKPKKPADPAKAQTESGPRLLTPEPWTAQTALSYAASPEEVIRREAYVIASIAATVFEHSTGVGVCMDLAEKILKRSKELAKNLNAERTEDRVLTVAEFAKRVCRDTNSSRATKSLYNVFYNSFLDTMLRVSVQEFERNNGRKPSSDETLASRPQLEEVAKAKALSEMQTKQRESQVAAWQEEFQRQKSHRSKPKLFLRH